MSHLTANLKALQIHQPASWSVLKAIYDSAFELEGGALQFLGRSWELATPVPVLAAPVAVLVYGMGDGAWIRAIREQIGALTPIIVLDPQPELAWACLAVAELTDLIADERLQWLVGSPESLLPRFAEAQLQLQDKLGLAWLENPPIAAIGTLLNEVVLRLYREQAAAVAGRGALDRLADLEALYADLNPEMARAYASYPLSCRSGCASCCQGSVGFHLCINPLEWALVHRELTSLDAEARRAVFERAVTSLARHSDFLIELLHYFDTQPERLQDPAFHLELLRMAGERRQEDCFLLGDDLRCRVYAGRPFTCRVFGNSHVQGRQPFTCGLDYDKIEKILLDEGPANRFVDSSAYRVRLWELHKGLDYKQVFNLWLLTHLDFERRDFKPLRLDYQQFQELVRHEDQLNQLLDALQAAARA